MYPLTCVGGYNVPARQGKYELCGFTAVVDTPGTAARVAIVDDPEIKSEWTTGRLLTDASVTPPTYQKNILVHKYANSTALESTIEWFPFTQTIKTRHGISVYVENIKQGSFCLYVK